MRQRHNGAVNLSVAWLLTDGLLASQLDPGACPFHQLTVPVLVAHDIPRLPLPVWLPSLSLCSTSLVHRLPSLALRLLPFHRSVAPVRVFPAHSPQPYPAQLTLPPCCHWQRACWIPGWTLRLTLFTNSRFADRLPHPLPADRSLEPSEA
jgi:hypothetical protein